MKYRTEITINLPRQQVTELFDDPDNLTQWQPTLVSFDHLTGEAGQPGAKSRLVYDQNGRTLEMVETITTRDLPDEFAGVYEAPGVKNRIVNTFVEENGKTRWIAENTFEFSGFMRIMAFFMRGAFPRQTREFMENFKRFAEGQ